MATSTIRQTSLFDNWQGGRTLAECNLRMLETQDSCDVTFRCGRNDHEIKAHTYVLISRSCAFHAMFSGPLAEKSNVTVPDIEPAFFKQLLLYLYTDEADIDADNVTTLLYVARKYEVSGLENKCTDFLEKNLTAENACIILEVSHRFEKRELFEKALTFIKGEGERSLMSPGFLALSQVVVDQVVESDDLVVDEHVVFTAVNSWAEAQCNRQAREITPETKRSILGKTLYKIRFPLMKRDFLFDKDKVSDLLTNDERLLVLDCVASPVAGIQQFSTNIRHSPRHIRQYSTSTRRFPSKYQLQWKIGKLFDAISFKSNKDLIIRGYQLYNQFNDTGKIKYKITSLFGNDDGGLNKMEEKIHTGSGEVFDVIFPKPAVICAGTWYTIAVKMFGPNTWRGEEGKTGVVCEDGVHLNFRNSTESTNGTRVSHGQIPSLIYTVI